MQNNGLGSAELGWLKGCGLVADHGAGKLVWRTRVPDFDALTVLFPVPCGLSGGS